LPFGIRYQPLMTGTEPLPSIEAPMIAWELNKMFFLFGYVPKLADCVNVIVGALDGFFSRITVNCDSSPVTASLNNHNSMNTAFTILPSATSFEFVIAVATTADATDSALRFPLAIAVLLRCT